jgi:hypothetical protein
MAKMSMWKRKAYFWVTLLLFALSAAGHWLFGWAAFKQEEFQHGSIPQFSDYFIVAMRDTFENWQSEFLQLIWQVVGLTLLWYTGSPASKEGDDRKEAKIDYILKKVDPEKAAEIIKELERKYPKK